MRDRLGSEINVHKIDDINHLVCQGEIILENMDNSGNIGYDRGIESYD